MIFGGNIVVVVNGWPGNVHEAKLLALHEEGRSAHGEDQGGKGLSPGNPVRTGGQEVIDGAGLIVVF